MNSFSLSTYDYALPEELIAQIPHEPADECRLLVYTESSSSSWSRLRVKDPAGSINPFIMDSSANASEWQIVDTIFSTLPSLLDPEHHILFFNESKVLRARVPLQDAQSITKTWSQKTFEGEIFFLRAIDEYSFAAMIYPGDRFPVGWTIHFWDIEISVESLIYEGRVLRIKNGISTREFLERYGQMPLPPYVEYSPEKESVYQPVFASKEGSVASPTASLHFTKRLLDELTRSWFRQEKVILHVGLGTFKNIYEENILDFEMHTEYIEVQRELFESIARYKTKEKTILAIGTTVTRTLESLPFLWPLIREKFDWSDECIDFWNLQCLSFPWKRESREMDPRVKPEDDKSKIVSSFSISGNTISFESKIFIYPGFEFCVIDELITNFHLPKSTLLMLVSAFAGIEVIKKIYAHAVREKYRFFSFGDAMYLKKNQ